MNTTDTIVVIVRIAVILLFTLSLIPVLVFMERKVSALVQDRPGPNRTNIGGIRLAGIVQSVADVLKLVFKENFRASAIKRTALFTVAPTIMLVISILCVSFIPFAGKLIVGDTSYEMAAVSTSISMLLYLAFSSLGVYGLMIAGYASSNKYSLLSSLRAAAGSISYELPMGLCIVSMALTYSSLNLSDYVVYQEGTFWGIIPAWGALVQPIAFLVFLVTAFAETNRLPFDTSEGESEIVAGYHLEYSAMAFGMFFLAEYIALVAMSALIVTMFLGGYQIPWVSNTMMLNHYSITIIIVLVALPVLTALFIRWMFKNNKTRYGAMGSNGLPLHDSMRRHRENTILAYFFTIVVGIIEVALIAAYMYQGALLDNIIVLVINFVVFAVKTILVIFFFMLIRWTLPRFRYDQLQKFSWERLLPIAIVNVVITAIVLVYIRS